MKIERDRIITIKHKHYKVHAVESRCIYKMPTILKYKYKFKYFQTLYYFQSYMKRREKLFPLAVT